MANVRNREIWVPKLTVTFMIKFYKAINEKLINEKKLTFGICDLSPL